jgi:mannose-6-phosphate isomerase-like protein (cupin superfamily)
VRILRAGDDAKGWLAGPWESDLPIAIGYASTAVDAPHTHERVTEIYLIAQGSAVAVIDGVAVGGSAGDVIIVEPEETRTFRGSSPDYRCFVLHVGGGDRPDQRETP